MGIWEIDETYNDHLTEDEERQLEDGLRILARIIAKSILRKRSLKDRAPRKEYSDLAAHPHNVTTPRKHDEPLALSVKAVAKILGLSRNSVYEAVRAGQIPSLRFGKRIVIPRAALEMMISQADHWKPNDERVG